jgi:hypothetical protein
MDDDHWEEWKGKCLAVRERVDGNWQRARVLDVVHFSTGFVLDVVLIDWGRRVRVDRLSQNACPLLPSDEDEVTVPPLAIEVRLFGLCPAEPNLDEETMWGHHQQDKAPTVVAKDWSPAAHMMVKSLVEAAENVFFCVSIEVVVRVSCRGV